MASMIDDESDYWKIRGANRSLSQNWLTLLIFQQLLWGVNQNLGKSAHQEIDLEIDLEILDIFFRNITSH